MKTVTLQDIEAHLVPSGSTTQTEFSEESIRVWSKDRAVREFTILKDLTLRLNQALAEKDLNLCVVLDESPHLKLYRCCFFLPSNEFAVILAQYWEEKAKFSTGKSIVGFKDGKRYYTNLLNLSQEEKDQFHRISCEFVRQLLELPAFRLLYYTGQIELGD